MDFWNTILGNNLARVLINTLPALEEKLTKKDQYGATVPNEEVVEYIDKRLQAGERFICKMPNGDGQTFVIMEEK